MGNTRSFLFRMVIFLGIVTSLGALLFAPLLDAFLANPALNGMILGGLLIGVIFMIRQVLLLRPEQRWLESWRSTGPTLSAERPPKLLGPVATMLGERPDGRMSLSAISLRSLLDSLDSRLAESRDISRYLIGLLIFLGLLGTFWGLLNTVGAVSDVIGNLQIDGGELGDAFDNLKSGLESPLSGMATAFSSSLFGLAGSLVLGFLDLQMGQAQNRFYNQLEEWLSSLTRLSGGGSGIGIGDGEVSVSGSAYQSALFEQTAESLDRLQRTIARNEDERSQASANLMGLNKQLTALTDQMRAEQDLMVRVGEAQLEMKSALARLAEGQDGEQNAAVRAFLQNIEACLIHMTEDNKKGRAQMIDEFRQETRLLARTIAGIGALGDGAARGPKE